MAKNKEELSKFFDDNDFSWMGEDGHGLSIGGKVVSEFNEYWHYFANGKVNTYLDIKNISDNIAEIRNKIQIELEKDAPFEQERRGVSKATASANMNNLRNIANKLDAYYRFCLQAGLPSGDPRLPIYPA